MHVWKFLTADINAVEAVCGYADICMMHSRQILNMLCQYHTAHNNERSKHSAAGHPQFVCRAMQYMWYKGYARLSTSNIACYALELYDNWLVH